MDLSKFKGKTLDGETLTELQAAITAHADTLESRALKAEEKARKAAQESIDGRKGKDAVIAKALEKLGIDSPDDLDNLPDAKGQAEALKQNEVVIKRLTRERDEAVKARDDMSGKYSAERRERAIAEQVAKHPFIDSDDARALIGARVRQEGDELLFAGADGKSVPLADGVAWMAKTKLHLIKPAGDGGKGSGVKSGASGDSAKTMTRSEFDALDPAARHTAIKSGTKLIE
jgi:hypothetical protein